MARFKIAAMQPGFVKTKTELPPEETAVTVEDVSASTAHGTDRFWVQNCTQCGKEHINKNKVDRCFSCGAFLPKGNYV